MKARQTRVGLTIGLALLVTIFGSANLAFSSLDGEYEIMEGEPSLHESGKVILFEFADFYCPHCHMFERVVVTKLQKEFGDEFEARMIGFPVMPGRILIVDDDEALRESLELLLSAENYEVATAAEGTTALKRAEATGRSGCGARCHAPPWPTALGACRDGMPSSSDIVESCARSPMTDRSRRFAPVVRSPRSCHVSP